MRQVLDNAEWIEHIAFIQWRRTLQEQAVKKAERAAQRKAATPRQRRR